MGLLQFLPLILLFAVVLWLFWPVTVQPAIRRARASRRPKAESADAIADNLFGVWSDQESRPSPQS